MSAVTSICVDVVLRKCLQLALYQLACQVRVYQSQQYPIDALMNSLAHVQFTKILHQPKLLLLNVQFYLMHNDC